MRFCVKAPALDHVWRSVLEIGSERCGVEVICVNDVLVPGKGLERVISGAALYRKKIVLAQITNEGASDLPRGFLV